MPIAHAGRMGRAGIERTTAISFRSGMTKKYVIISVAQEIVMLSQTAFRCAVDSVVNTEVLTKLNQISSSVENTSVTT
jgi:hypothetical protein